MQSEGAQRSDAVANRKVVIEAANEVLAGNPDASIQEIADFSGLGRSTVYRHFPNREELFVAIVTDALGEAVAGVEAIAAGSASFEQGLREMGEFLAELALRHPIAYSNSEGVKPALDRLIHNPGLPLTRYLIAGAERGEIRDDLPPDWIAAIVTALTISIAGDVFDGRVEREDAGRLLGDTFVAMTAVRT